MSSADPMLWAAHTYAERFGFAVFPLRPRSKAPACSGGFKAATCDHTQIEAWWRRTPSANVGIATGTVSNLIVLDMDPRNGGEESHLELRQKFGRWSDTPISHTGGGGTHEVFRHPGNDEVPCRTNVGGFAGIDLKGDGGYIVAPPSIHPSGEPYVWDLYFGLESFALASAPGWFVDLARQGPTTNAAAYEAEIWDGTVPDRVSYAVAVSNKVARRFHRDPRGLTDGSPSGIDFSLACLLARFGCDGPTIEAGLRASRARADLSAKRDSYFHSTIGKALTLAGEGRHDG
jgi:hypothetical protein